MAQGYDNEILTSLYMRAVVIPASNMHREKEGQCKQVVVSARENLPYSCRLLCCACILCYSIFPSIKCLF